MKQGLFLLLLVGIAFQLRAQSSRITPPILTPGSGPQVLIVQAHPDDETTFPVTIYKITHDLKGTVDLALITDAQGGFRGSELGSQYYGLDLTDSVIGRAHLPAIRKQELKNAGKIMGIRNYFFFDQVDDWYTQNPQPYTGGQKWDVPTIEKKLDQVLTRTAYDYVFVLLPHPGQHGHHKSASILALRAVKRLLPEKRPIVLGGSQRNKAETQSVSFTELPGFPETRINSKAPIFAFDRVARFGHENKLSYMIVADWVNAEYKSQGDLQNNGIHVGDLETFWYFDLNDERGIAKVTQLFERLKSSGCPIK